MRLTPTRLAILLLAVLLSGWLLGRCAAPEEPAGGGAADGAGAAAEAGAPAAPTVWTCSMDPQIQLPEFGLCPICGMDLIPLAADDGASPRSLSMSAGAKALADIQTAPSVRREVAHELQLIGKVEFDETRVATITSWVPGRLERLYVDYTGVAVRPGDHLVDLYSPELYAAQQELRQAIETAARLSGSAVEGLDAASGSIVTAARAKLRLLGLAADQVEEIERSGALLEHLTIRAPIGGVVIHKRALEGMYVDEGSPIYTIADLSKVWVQLAAYESDLAWLRYGQEVEFEVEAYPGERFHGRISFIDPVLDDATRTVRVRVNVDNLELRLKPEMFVHATVRAALTPHGKAVDADLAGRWMCPMHPEVLADGPAACSECGMDLVPVTELGFVTRGVEELPLVIPATAPLLTGRRAVVYVEQPDEERPTFEGREILLGPRAGDWYVVREGLAEGERVVVNGAFKLDSELQLKAKPSMMNPGDEEAPDRPAYEAPEAFRRQLGALVEPALRVQRALAGDDYPAARPAAEQLLTALDGVEMALLTGEAHRAWMRAMGGIRAGAEGVAAGPEIEAARAAFQRLSDGLIAALRAFDYAGGPESVQVTHCPMAFEDAGADWLQLPGDVANPYFGAAMFRCGSAVELLGAGAAGPEPAAPEAEAPPADAADPAGPDGAEAGTGANGPRGALGGLLRPYLAAQEALAADDLDAAAEAAGDLVDALRAVAAPGLADAEAAVWQTGRERLRNAAKQLFRAEELAPGRQAFDALSQALIGLLDRFGYQRDAGALQLFHCPMAFDNRGADWIQAGDTTANPYFGAAMLRCGSAVRELPRER